MSVNNELARITSVRTVDGTVYVNATPPRPGVEYKDMPLLKLFPGGLVTPAEGDIVEVHQLADGNRAAAWVASASSIAMPTLGESELCFRFSDGTEIRVQKGVNGYTVDIAGDETVTVKSGQKVVVESPSVYLGGETGAQPVARKGDPVSVDTTTGAGQIDSGSTSVNSA